MESEKELKNNRTRKREKGKFEQEFELLNFASFLIAIRESTKPSQTDPTRPEPNRPNKSRTKLARPHFKLNLNSSTLVLVGE